MTRRLLSWLLLSAVVSAGWAGASEVQGPTRAEVEAMMGLACDGDRVRGQMDTVGFVVGEAAAEEVVSTAIGLEQDSLAAQDRRLGMGADDGFIGGVCPHDDHLYASRVYAHLTERITAPRVILIGVFHRAKSWDLRDRMVFDHFDSWHGPWGPIEVDELRGELIAALPPENYVIDNTMHAREHSLEAILPFLQRGHPQRTIVPILVPHMGWERLEELTGRLADAVVEIMKRKQWKLGKDLAILVSSDSVHYGHDFDHAPFGTDAAAYEDATRRDRSLIHENLEGRLESASLRRLLVTLVDPETLDYRLPWCGRFSIPFGLELLRKVALGSEGKIPEGALLRYGTSLSDPELPVSAEARETGLGYTAPSNLHHWVGYASVGYLIPE
jgi:AmmeMemoRadiSam system protein B